MTQTHCKIRSDFNLDCSFLSAMPSRISASRRQVRNIKSDVVLLEMVSR